jgi:hypothetical protein
MPRGCDVAVLWSVHVSRMRTRLGSRRLWTTPQLSSRTGARPIATRDGSRSIPTPHPTLQIRFAESATCIGEPFDPFERTTLHHAWGRHHRALVNRDSLGSARRARRMRQPSRQCRL